SSRLLLRTCLSCLQSLLIHRTSLFLIASLSLSDALPIFLVFSALCVVRGLHSFPTRRSSDLTTTAQPGNSSRAFSSEPRERPARSEEHTSELQSRFDLVCRLLLEKKKKRERRR